MLSPRRLLAAALLLWGGWVLQGLADERILSYHSDIQVFREGHLEVTETIRVRSEGKEIKRGIYRDYPTSYRDRYRNKVVVNFEVTQVLRDGKPEAHHFEQQSNGMRVYVGRKQHFLPNGEYTYTLRYRTNRQLGFFEEHDELYYNVTGNGWSFPIDRASATITLPETVPAHELRLEGYTGPKGSTDRHFSAGIRDDGKAVFETTRPLGRHEGLTIVAMWPKGHVTEPSQREKLGYLFSDNRSLLIALGGLLFLTAYYLITWAAVGIDPEKGTIIPRFTPPDHVSPAAARYVMRMGYDHTCFAAALIHLAVKGYVKLKEHDGDYTVNRVKTHPKGLSRGERKIFDKLLGRRSKIKLKQSNHATIGGALKAFQKSLKEEYQKKCFYTNTRYLFPGIIITLITLALFVIFSDAGPEAAFFCLWLSIWTLGVVFLLRQMISSWQGVFHGGGSGLIQAGQIGGAIFTTLFATPFVVAEVVVLGILANMTSIPGILVIVAMVALTVLFYHLLKAPTRLGRKLMDELEGFRLYLSVAEQDRLAYMKSPEKTPELFETFLPYALALDVEQEWAEQFAGILEASAREPAGGGYRPRWYTGRSLTTGALAGAVGGALAGAIAASSTAPGSSSGGGGGGSSGGGGGGGGGGGW